MASGDCELLDIIPRVSQEDPHTMLWWVDSLLQAGCASLSFLPPGLISQGSCFLQFIRAVIPKLPLRIKLDGGNDIPVHRLTNAWAIVWEMHDPSSSARVLQITMGLAGIHNQHCLASGVFLNEREKCFHPASFHYLRVRPILFLSTC